MDAREGFSDPAGAKVRAQLDQLSDLLCRGGASARTQAASYTLPDFTLGSTQVGTQRITKMWCPPQLRKRLAAASASTDKDLLTAKLHRVGLVSPGNPLVKTA